LRASAIGMAVLFSVIVVALCLGVDNIGQGIAYVGRCMMWILALNAIIME